MQKERERRQGLIEKGEIPLERLGLWCATKVKRKGVNTVLTRCRFYNRPPEKSSVTTGCLKGGFWERQNYL